MMFEITFKECKDYNENRDYKQNQTESIELEFILIKNIVLENII